MVFFEKNSTEPKTCSAGLSKLHFMCPEEHIEVLKKFYLFLPIWQLTGENSTNLAKDFVFLTYYDGK